MITQGDLYPSPCCLFYFLFLFLYTLLVFIPDIFCPSPGCPCQGSCYCNKADSPCTHSPGKNHVPHTQMMQRKQDWLEF
ncbi:hypothetical protein BDW42DRAFT_90280 [Aspergillus taichungensis]|uniref:Uncharacterized protein n=1 Tax=Aspergillus taichungensis TaxID=482145 RepID=A0A2J5HWP5_9EURO|nr:hypothetical protein BDW42DRAFT_90280 [Aspergillus taichungensis]